MIYSVSRNFQQLNQPTGSPRVDAGMTSELIRLSDPAIGEEPYACWLRRSKLTGEVVYAGFYTSCELPGREGRFVKVVFPYPAARRPCCCARRTAPTAPSPSSPPAAASATRATVAFTGRRKARYACGASR